MKGQEACPGHDAASLTEATEAQHLARRLTVVSHVCCHIILSLMVFCTAACPDAES